MTERQLFSAQAISKSFDGVAALRDFSCSIGPGEMVGLIGPNGAGKTTFLNIVSGLIEADAGRIFFSGKEVTHAAAHERARLGMARTFQDNRVLNHMSALENVLLHFRLQPGERLSEVFFRPARVRRYERQLRDKAMELLERASLADQAAKPAGRLSYGQQKLLAIMCALAADASLLLLDEPAAGVAPSMLDRILAILHDTRSSGCSAIVIEHDLQVIDQLCGRVIFMEAGATLTEGPLEAVRRDPRVLDAYLASGGV